MKIRKLPLRRETIRQLTAAECAAVLGGYDPWETVSCPLVCEAQGCPTNSDTTDPPR